MPQETLIKLKIFILWIWLFAPSFSQANNLQISNVKLTGRDTSLQTLQVAFDLSWENSWRTSHGPGNWDAVWIFLKFRKAGQHWEHATLNYVDGSGAADGHLAPPSVAIETPADGKGAFIYRAVDGFGSNDWSGLELRWNYGQDGVSNGDHITLDVYGIEMVHVPKGTFKAGGGFGNEAGKLFQWMGPLQFNLGYEIASEGIIPVGQNNGYLYYLSNPIHDSGDQGGPIPASFPKGFAAFYCMKYEVSQSQWIAFFNALTTLQRDSNDLTDLDHRGPNPIDRNTIEWESNGGAYTGNQFTPVTFPLWDDVLAYLDWSALRPMTELEFVKACRGPLPPVSNGYAWGTNAIIDTDFTYDLLNENEEDELLVNHAADIGNANWINSAIFEDGPYRCGIFAASSSQPTREDVGASYYGIMELSGNISEMCVTIGTPEGRAFQGLHGDGALTIGGNANVNGWPPGTGEGGGLFGGSWFSLGEELRINDRRAATIGNVGYFNDVGFRGVRTAPQ